MKVTILFLAFLFLSASVPAFETTAYACGGWWDPCCPWWEPERCAAFDAAKRQKAAENEAYFGRMEERLTTLARVVGWLPAGGLAASALSEAARAARKAKDANAAVARGGSSGPSDYADYTDYEYVNQLEDNAYWLVEYGNYAAGEAQKYTDCKQQGYEDWCNQYKDTANYGGEVVGWLHGEMAYNLEVLAWQVENENGGDYPFGDISYWLRDMAQVSYDTEGAFQ